MRIHFYCLLICCLMGLQLGVSMDRLSMEKLRCHDNYNAIVRGMIENWESPIVYLRQLGYLPSDYEDTSKIKPSLDALMNRLESNDHRDLQLSSFSRKRKRKDVSPQKNQKQRESAAAGNQHMNYPTVDRLLLMSRQSKPQAADSLLPAERGDVSQLQLLNPQRTDQVLSSNDEMIHRLLNKIRSNKIQQLQLAGASKNVANMPQYSFEPQQSPMRANGGRSTADILAISKANELKVNSMLSSRPDQTQTEIRINPEIAEPHYLNWDLANNRLKIVSPVARDSYVDKLVQIFAKKQEKG